LSAMRKAYGDAFVVDNDPCDACMWSKARMHPRPKTSRRPALMLGHRLHYDVFHGPSKSDEGHKYVLVVIDEFTSRSWAVGLKKKSLVFDKLVCIIRETETRMRGERVFALETGFSDEPHVVEIRSDNAGENIVQKMRDLLRRKGTRMETSVPYQQWQNGKAEKLGGYIMKGGAALRYGGCLPMREWFRCVSAFNHIRNRIPNTNSAKHDGATPYELWHSVRIPLDILLEHLKVVGSLMYVVYPPQLVPNGSKVSFKGVMLGYADENEKGQKAYIVRRLSDGKIMSATYAQTTCYEMHLPFKTAESGNDCLNVVDLEHDDVKDRDIETESESSDDEKQELDDSSDSDLPELLESDAESDDDDDSDDRLLNRVYIDRSKKSADSLGPIASASARNSTLADRKCHDIVDENDDESVMDGVGDMVHNLHLRARNKIKHSHKLRSRSGGLDELKVERKLEDMGSDDDVCLQDNNTHDTPPPFPIEQPPLAYEVVRILDVARQGKKRNGPLIFEVLWKGGETSWEPVDNFLGGAQHELGVFLETMSAKQKGAFKRGEYNKIQELLNCDDVDIERVLSGRVHSPDAEVLRAKRMNEKFEIVQAIVKLTRETADMTVPATLNQAKKHPKWGAFNDDMKVEFDNFNKKGVWRLVPRPAAGVNVVSVRWVFDIKMKNGVVYRFKARLVCRGFAQKAGEDYDPNELYAPTMKTKTLRALAALAARNGWNINQYDVSCAFLHADLDGVVYVEQPAGFVVLGKEDWVYVLDKAMYGLKQAPRKFSDHLAKCYRGLAFKQSVADECLWILTKPDNVVLYALYHVDDIIMTGNDDALRDKCYQALSAVLDIRDEGRVDVFLNMKFIYGMDGSVSLSQTHYIEKLAERFGLTDDAKVTSPGLPDDVLSHNDLPVSESDQMAAARLPYPALIGSLIYTGLTRPDVVYSISNVAMYMSRWGEKHYAHALRILKYLYHTRHKTLTYRKWSGDVALQCYVDANYGDKRESGLGDKWRSQGGYLVFVGDCLVSWSSKRHRCVTLSSMEAEYVEATRAAQEVVWCRRLLKDLGYEQKSPTVLWEDNKAAIAFSKNHTCHDRSKHIDIREHWLRDLVLGLDVRMLHVATVNQLADFLTKHLRAPAHILVTDIILSGMPLPQVGHSFLEIVNCVKFLNRKNSMFFMGDQECF
jgi:transposase InsO family protein